MPAPIQINSRKLWDRDELTAAFKDLKETESNPWDDWNDKAVSASN